MKKIIVSIILIICCILVLAMFLTLSSCESNKQPLEITYDFDYAMLVLPNGEIVEGEVQSWADFDNVDQIQVKIRGITYLVHSSNIVLEAK